jgi:ribosomal subunit interface protein
LFGAHPGGAPVPEIEDPDIEDPERSLASGQEAMNLTVNGKGIDVGEALRTYVAEGLDRMFEKYFSNPIEATVTFSKQGYRFHAMISVHVGRGILMQAEDDGGDAYAAFDIAAETISKRLRRHKRRLRDHHRADTDSYAAKQFVLAADVGEESTEAGVDHANGHAALIVAELEADIPTLTVGEAVMRLDLAETQAMLFHNRAHGGLNMVYRRNDGNIGWVDPATKPDAVEAEPRKGVAEPRRAGAPARR